MAAQWTYYGNGTKSKIRKRDGKRIFYCEVWSKGKRYTAKGGSTERQATKLLGTLQTQIDDGTFEPPREKKRRERVKQAQRLTFAAYAEQYIEARRGSGGASSGTALWPPPLCAASALSAWTS